MAAPTKTKRPHTSRLIEGLKAASPNRVIREERALVMKRIAKWTSAHRWAPTITELALRYRWSEPPLRERLNDLVVEGLAIKRGRGWELTEAGWLAVGREPVPAVFSSHMDERIHQYRMCHYFAEAVADPDFTSLYETWLHNKRSKELVDERV